MKKIEVVQWLSEGQIEDFKRISCRADGDIALYEENALQAVAEAVHQQWLLYCDNQSEMEMPDLAAIINQLKGK